MGKVDFDPQKKMPDSTSSFKVISLSHSATPVGVRELFHLTSNDCQELLRKLKQGLDIHEALVISTCNRTEVYYIADADLSAEIIKLICIEKGIGSPEAYFSYFQPIIDDKKAIRYLFEVSMGLHSHVLGDLQIINQVKKAYRLTHEAKMAEAFLHRLLHTVFHTNKRVYQETSFRDGAASVSYAAAELAKEQTRRLKKPTVLVAGLGEMGADVARSLDKKHFHSVSLSNRTYEKAIRLASESDAVALPFATACQQLDDFDVIISGISVEKPFWEKSMFADIPKDNILVIDLGVPRSVNSEVGTLPHVDLYNIDDIVDRTSRVLTLRKAAKASVQCIIEEELATFLEWRSELKLSPTIQKMKSALDQIRKEEMARFLKNANKEESQLVADVTQGILNKFMKLPVMTLKDACKRGEQEDLIEMIHELFDLERTRKKKTETRGQGSVVRGQKPDVR